MRKYRLHFLVLALLLLVTALYEWQKPVPVNWNPTLINSDKNPFGTYILYQELNQVFPDQDISESRIPVYNLVTDSTLPLCNYILIAHNITLSSLEQEKLISFAAAGNHAFIASSEFDSAFCHSLGLNLTYETQLFSKKDSSFRFCNPLAGSQPFTIPVYTRSWFSLIDSTADVSGIIEDMDKKVVMLRVATGEGSITLCTLPLLFTNYTVMQPGNSQLAFTALSYLPRDRSVVWDEYQKQGRKEDNSVLRVILANKTLKWVYFLSLTGLLLVLVFETRRRRSMVAVVDPVRNTTVDFVNVVGMLHYEQRNFGDIARKRIALLLERIRIQFLLPTLTIDKEFARALSAKSGFDLAETEKLIDKINFALYAHLLSAEDLIELNKSIELFITTTKLKI